MQVLSYFCHNSLPNGALVQVPIGRQKVNALVIGSQPLSDQKIHLKRSRFQVKNIARVISQEPILNQSQLALMKYLSDYYASPLTLFAKTFLPAYLLRKKQPVNLLWLSGGHSSNQQPKPLLIIKKERAEIYRDLINECLSKSKQVLLLVPEISLGNHWLEVFQDLSPVFLTSEMTEKTFFLEWQKIRSGETHFVIGSRIAVFANFFNLGLIILDEEQSPHYKSWDMMPYYHTKNAALKLSEFYNAQIVFGSEFPSIESYHFAEQRNYELVVEKKIDVAQRSINVIDMRNEIFGRNYSIFSFQTQKALENILSDKNKKAILFVSRRGSQAFIFCQDCGYLEKCRQCETYLVYHAIPKKALICHRCGWQKEPPSACERCHSGRLKTFGVGTQKVAEEIEKLWQYKHSLILDYDSAPTYKDQQKIIAQFQENKHQILIGTQALIGKPNMPKADLVVIVSLDNLFFLPDYKIGERIFRLISGLLDFTAPRAQFLFQTHDPENEILQNIVRQDYGDFLKKEIAHRKELNYPPFSQIVKISVKDAFEKRARQNAAEILKWTEKAIADSGAEAEAFGPAPAYTPRVKNQYIYQIILKIMKMDEQARNKMLRKIAEQAVVDVDPESML